VSYSCIYPGDTYVIFVSYLDYTCAIRGDTYVILLLYTGDTMAGI
jgi:hypothetical protein